MSIVSVEEQLEDRAFDGWEELGNAERRMVGSFSRERARAL